MAVFTGSSNDASKAGVNADNTANGPALWASANPQGRAVVGVSTNGVGLWGEVVSGRAVVGAVDTDGTGVWGESKTGTGVVGKCLDGDGVVGTGRRGVVGESTEYQGVYGHSVKNCGLVGVSEGEHAVFAETHAPGSAGIYAHNTAGGRAAVFDGPVQVNGHLTVTGDVYCPGADYAEELPAGAEVSAGDCVVLDDDACVVRCAREYDTRVAGIVSGAGGLRPAFVLDRQVDGVPIALMGKAYVRVDADRGPVRVGDLLTTSATPGHAMRVDDMARATGAMIGKAMSGLSSGRGMVKVFVSGR